MRENSSTDQEIVAVKISEDQAWLIYPGRDTTKLAALHPNAIRREILVMQQYVQKLDSALSNALIREHMVQTSSSAMPKKTRTFRNKTQLKVGFVSGSSERVMKTNPELDIKKQELDVDAKVKPMGDIEHSEEKRSSEKVKTIKGGNGGYTRSKTPTSFIPKVAPKKRARTTMLLPGKAKVHQSST